MLASRRVRRLTIRGQEPVAMPRITALMEDAINTASLPNIPAHGVVFIRKIELGRISASTHSQFISKRLDQLLRNLSFSHITISNPEQEDSTAVWFADAIEPYRILSDLIARGKSANAWYWPLAVPHWANSMSASESMQLFMSELVQQPTAMTGLSYALEPFVLQGSMLTVLDQLSTREIKAAIGELTLPEFNFNPQETFKQASFTQDQIEDHPVFDRLNPQWKLFLRQSLHRWTKDQLKLRLALALTIHKAGMLPSNDNINRLVSAVLHDENSVGQYDRMSAGKENSERMSAPDAALVSSADHFSVYNKPADHIAASADNLLTESLRIESDQDITIDSTADNFDGFTLPRKAQDLDHQRIDNYPAEPQMQPLTGHYLGNYTDYGGFLFLLPLMQRLGITGLADENNEQQLLHHVLWRIADWLRIPRDDSVLQFIEQPVNDKPANSGFFAPGQWKLLFNQRRGCQLQLYREQGQAGRLLLKDPISRLTLAVWNGENQKEPNYWLDNQQYQPAQELSAQWAFEQLVDNLVIAMCRYLRLYAQMSLRTLVKRPAYVASTQTHVDMSLSLADLDHRVRMAGLDIDPGWLPSLGHVFYFHYIDDHA